MYFKNDLEAIKKQLAKRAMFDKAAAAAWSKVEIKRKKNGEDFQNLKAALVGANLYRSYSFDEYPQMHIYITAGFNEDTSIETYGFCDELPKDDPRHDTPASKWVRATYQLTAAELEKRIAERVEYYTTRAAELERELEQAETLYNEYREAVKLAEDRLSETLKHYRKVDGKMHTSSLFWLITETR